MSKRNPNSADTHIGQRIRLARQVGKMSQQALAERLGLTYQQVQKYEKGMNRIAAGQLWKIAGILGLEMTWFIDGLDALPDESGRMMRISDDAIGLAIQLDRLPGDRRALAIRIVRACLEGCQAMEVHA